MELLFKCTGIHLNTGNTKAIKISLCMKILSLWMHKHPKLELEFYRRTCGFSFSWKKKCVASAFFAWLKCPWSLCTARDNRFWNFFQLSHFSVFLTFPWNNTVDTCSYQSMSVSKWLKCFAVVSACSTPYLFFQVNSKVKLGTLCFCLYWKLILTNPTCFSVVREGVQTDSLLTPCLAYFLERKTVLLGSARN